MNRTLVFQASSVQLYFSFLCERVCEHRRTARVPGDQSQYINTNPALWALKKQQCICVCVSVCVCVHVMSCIT